MKNNPTGPKKKVIFVGIATFALLMLSMPALAFKATGGLTGWWEQTEEQNHGLIIAISRLPGGDQTGVVFWAHYDLDGNPTWLLAQGPLRGNVIDGDLYKVEGVGFMQPKGMSPPAEQKVGTLEVDFQDCNQGTVTYNAPNLLGSGVFEIGRLTTVPGMDCTGGVSDNVPPSARPERFEVDLEPTADFAALNPDADGEAKWMMNPGLTRFELEIEDVPEGTYTLNVILSADGDGNVPDPLMFDFEATVDDDDGEVEGKIKFSSPQRGNQLLLDFDPRGALFEILQGDLVVLASMEPSEGNPVGGDKRPGDGEDEVEIEIDMNNLLPDDYPDAEAEVEWSLYDRVELFEIEIENVPAGTYEARVDGFGVGFISVQIDEEDGDSEGDLILRSPPLPELGFDPRGALIEVAQGEMVFFEVLFPEKGDQGESGKGPDRDVEISVVIPKVTAESDYAEASAKATWEKDDDAREFEVEIERVLAGQRYTLRVLSPNPSGTIHVEATLVADEDGEADITFSSESGSDDRDFNFPVRGKLIQISDSTETVIFEGLFPKSD